MAQVKISDMTALSAAVDDADLVEIETSGGASRRATGQEVRTLPLGQSLRITTGSNATAGTATLSSGSVTVNTDKVTANSLIMLTPQNSSGTPGSVYVSARSAGASFTISSTSGSDTRSVAWMIIEPAA